MSSSTINEKFNSVYCEYLHKVRHFCFSYIQDKEVCEDITQDVFETLWQRRESVVLDSSVLPYLLVIAGVTSQKRWKRLYRILKIDKIINTRSKNETFIIQNYNTLQAKYDYKEIDLYTLYKTECATSNTAMLCYGYTHPEYLLSKQFDPAFCCSRNSVVTTSLALWEKTYPANLSRFDRVCPT